MTAAALEPVDPGSTEIRATYAAFLRSTLGRSPLTVGAYDRVLRKVAWNLPHGDLVVATDDELKRIFNLSTWAQALAPRTKRSNLGTVIGFYDWLLEDACLISAVPTLGLRRLAKRLEGQTQKLPTYLAMPEVDRLMDALGAGSRGAERHGLRDQTIAGVMAYAGGRQTETIRGLQRGDVDLRAGELTFRTMTKRGKQRSVPISPLLRPLLEAWLRVREDVPSETLFLTSRGTPHVNPANWTTYDLDPAARRAGLQWVICELHGRNGCVPAQRGVADSGCTQAGWRVHPHTLRHSFAVEALRSGACNIAELRDLLGHANIATTNIYLQLVKEPSSTERFRRRFGKQQTR